MKFFNAMGNDKFIKSSIFIWSVLILSLGLQFRIRNVDNALTVDWVIIMQVIISFASAIIGFLLTDKFYKWGYGAKLFLAYIIIAFLSGIFSPFPKLVFGYSILLAGVGFLTIGLTQRANNLQSLLKLEKTWLFTVLFIIIVNSSLTGFSSESIDSNEIYRFGEGTVSPTMLSALCAYALAVSFMNIRKIYSPVLFWIIQLLLIMIIILTRTRMALALCCTTLLLQFLFKLRRNKFHPWVMFFCILFSIISITALLYSFDFPFVKEMFYTLNRQDISTIYDATGRTSIWSTTFKILAKDTYRCLIGYGYGISRLVINDEFSKTAIFYAYHTHNYLIENLFNMGVLGLITALLFIIYGTKWIVDYKILCKYYSHDFALRALSIMILFFMSGITGIPLGGKIYPYAFIIIFYLLALDNKSSMSEMRMDTVDISRSQL